MSNMEARFLAFGFLVFLMLLALYLQRRKNAFRVTLERDPNEQVSGLLYSPMEHYIKNLRKECLRAVDRLAGMPEHTKCEGRKDIEEYWVKSVDRLIAADRDAAKNALHVLGLTPRAPYAPRKARGEQSYGIVRQMETVVVGDAKRGAGMSQ